MFTNWFELASPLVVLLYYQGRTTSSFYLLYEISRILTCLLSEKLLCCSRLHAGNNRPQRIHIEMMLVRGDHVYKLV